jgi:hypothetical protein
MTTSAGTSISVSAAAMSAASARLSRVAIGARDKRIDELRYS